MRRRPRTRYCAPSANSRLRQPDTFWTHYTWVDTTDPNRVLRLGTDLCLLTRPLHSRTFVRRNSETASRAAGASTLPTLLLCVTLQADGDGWSAIAVKEALLVDAPMRWRDRAPGASGGVGTLLAAIFSDPDEVTSRAPAPTRTAGASRCRAGIRPGRRFACSAPVATQRGLTSHPGIPLLRSAPHARQSRPDC